MPICLGDSFSRLVKTKYGQLFQNWNMLLISNFIRVMKEWQNIIPLRVYCIQKNCFLSIDPFSLNCRLSPLSCCIWWLSWNMGEDLVAFMWQKVNKLLGNERGSTHWWRWIDVCRHSSILLQRPAVAFREERKLYMLKRILAFSWKKVVKGTMISQGSIKLFTQS